MLHINGILVRIRDEAGVPFSWSSVLLLTPAQALKCFSNIDSARMLEDAQVELRGDRKKVVEDIGLDPFVGGPVLICAEAV